jgi:hypothetical protein
MDKFVCVANGGTLFVYFYHLDALNTKNDLKRLQGSGAYRLAQVCLCAGHRGGLRHDRNTSAGVGPRSAVGHQFCMLQQRSVARDRLRLLRSYGICGPFQLTPQCPSALRRSTCWMSGPIALRE